MNQDVRGRIYFLEMVYGCFFSGVNRVFLQKMRAIRVFGERVTPNYCEQRNISRITTCINMYVSIIFVKRYDMI